MPVNSTHAEYDANAASWSRARDVFAGEDAVKAAGEKYLPRLDCQDLADYHSYKNRSSFFNATSRTGEGFVGLIFRRDPVFKISAGASPLAAAMQRFLEDANLLGTSLTAYAKQITEQVMMVGRAGTLVDWNEDTEQRAYAVMYLAEDILNWQTARVRGRQVLSLVVLKEAAQKASADGFVPEAVEQLRVLKLVPPANPSADWSYAVEVWQLLPEGGAAPVQTRRGRKVWQLIQSLTPTRHGQTLPLIPFVFHGPRHSLPDVDKLPLADIIYKNLDHYRLDADFKHGLHFTALPTVWVSGFDKAPDLRIGSRAAWVADSDKAKVGFLEFHGDGLQTFERAMDRDEQMMAVLGTRMLESRKRVGETAAAIELRQSGENSILTNISLSLSASLTQVLRWVHWWHSQERLPDGIGPDCVLATLNTDFSITGMTAVEINAVVAAWQAGAISQETMLDLFRAGEVIAPGRTNAEEMALLAKRPVAVTPTQPGDVNALPVTSGQ